MIGYFYPDAGLSGIQVSISMLKDWKEKEFLPVGAGSRVGTTGSNCVGYLRFVIAAI